MILPLTAKIYLVTGIRYSTIDGDGLAFGLARRGQRGHLPQGRNLQSGTGPKPKGVSRGSELLKHFRKYMTFKPKMLQNYQF